MKIESGTRVYRIADLSEVWVIATVYEYQLPFIKVGQPATMTLPYLTESFEGEVAYIYPFLQEESRQVDVRLEFPNPEGPLKPGMFATVQIESMLDQQAVLAPREAIIATGRREVAFVSLGEGKFDSGQSGRTGRSEGIGCCTNDLRQSQPGSGRTHGRNRYPAFLW